jgi:hypothetical protein
MTTKTLKAYEVREADEGRCVVVFATNGATARREGASELNMEFEDVDSCTRAPEFDQYAPGPVPLHATLENGWWHTCMGCQCTFDIDGRRDFDEDDREDEFNHVTDAKGHTYCSPTCMMQDWAERREHNARQAAAVEVVSTKWPEATNITTYQSAMHGQVHSYFRLPGVQDPISWAPGDKTAMVALRSAEDFKRLYGPKETS